MFQREELRLKGMTQVDGGIAVSTERGTPEFLLLGEGVCPGLR